MVDHARHTLWQWQDAGKIGPIYADQWEVLSKLVADVRRMIGEDSQSGRDLRQNSAFAGMRPRRPVPRSILRRRRPRPISRRRCASTASTRTRCSTTWVSSRPARSTRPSRTIPWPRCRRRRRPRSTGPRRARGTTRASSPTATSTRERATTSSSRRPWRSLPASPTRRRPRRRRRRGRSLPNSSPGFSKATRPSSAWDRAASSRASRRTRLPGDIAKAVKEIDRVGWETPAAEAYHSRKHPIELPPGERTGNPVEDYAKVTRDVVKNGTVEEAVRVTDPDTGIVKTKVVISHIVGQGAEAEKVRAIIFVGPDGTVTIATLGP